MSVNLIPGKWNDIVNQLGRGQTPFKKNNDVGAKHSGEQFCSSTEIFLSECFALSDRGGVRSCSPQGWGVRGANRSILRKS